MKLYFTIEYETFESDMYPCINDEEPKIVRVYKAEGGAIVLVDTLELDYEDVSSNEIRSRYPDAESIELL